MKRYEICIAILIILLVGIILSILFLSKHDKEYVISENSFSKEFYINKIEKLKPNCSIEVHLEEIDLSHKRCLLNFKVRETGVNYRGWLTLNQNPKFTNELFGERGLILKKINPASIILESRWAN